MATKMTEGSRKVFEYLKAAGVGVAFKIAQGVLEKYDKMSSYAQE